MLFFVHEILFMKFLLIAAAALAILPLGGCASSPDSATNKATPTSYEEPVYRIGSNIPVRDKAPPLTEKEKAERAAEAQRTLEAMRRTGAGIPKQ